MEFVLRDKMHLSKEKQSIKSKVFNLIGRNTTYLFESLLYKKPPVATQLQWKIGQRIQHVVSGILQSLRNGQKTKCDDYQQEQQLI